MNIQLKEIASVTMTLFATIDVLGAVPVIIDLQKKAGKIESGKASLIAMLLMVVFLFVGDHLLNMIGIDISSFAVAGSVIIFLIGLEMVVGMKIFHEETFHTISIVPLAFPLIAGAGTMSTLLSLKTQFDNWNIVAAIMINVLFVFIVLKNTYRIEVLLGSKGLAIIRKAFGLILLAMAIKLFKVNIML